MPHSWDVAYWKKYYLKKLARYETTIQNIRSRAKFMREKVEEGTVHYLDPHLLGIEEAVKILDSQAVKF